MNVILETSVSLLPSIILLLVFVLMDSYKLLSLKAVIISIIIGALAAIGSYFSNTFILNNSNVDWVFYSRYVAPFIEELFKGLVLVYLIRFNRIGFNIDAAIYGFSLGAGFAIVENVYYIMVLEQDTSLGVFVIRGFGTALMHGGTTTIFAVISKTLIEGRIAEDWSALLAGFLLSVAFHSFYNHFFFDPILLTIIILITLPLVLMFVFKRSEDFLQNWLGVGFDSDQDLLDLVNHGHVSETPLGEYLELLKSRFKGEIIFDMICLLKIHLELSLRAKGILMIREVGVDSQPDLEIKDKFKELHFLEKNIGRSGMLALSPFLHQSSQDLWQLHMLEEQG
tara:strand:- start:1942 stop:2958 length:1017 start_codon:yes stop_codon:yes gene_type:complete